MRRTIIALGCILLAGPALAQSVGEKTGINSALGVAPTTTDFVKEVALSDMFEIESSKLDEQKGNAQEKSFAQQMVTDHTEISNDLKDRGCRDRLRRQSLPRCAEAGCADTALQRRLCRRVSSHGQGRAHGDRGDPALRHPSDRDRGRSSSCCGSRMPSGS